MRIGPGGWVPVKNSIIRLHSIECKHQSYLLNDVDFLRLHQQNHRWNLSNFDVERGELKTLTLEISIWVFSRWLVNVLRIPGSSFRSHRLCFLDTHSRFFLPPTKMFQNYWRLVRSLLSSRCERSEAHFEVLSPIMSTFAKGRGRCRSQKSNKMSHEKNLCNRKTDHKSSYDVILSIQMSNALLAMNTEEK